MSGENEFLTLIGIWIVTFTGSYKITAIWLKHRATQRQADRTAAKESKS